MKKLKMDLELSKKFYRELKDVIEANNCYKNAFMTMDYADGNFFDDYKIAYGFIDSSINGKKLLFRHAFIIRKKDNAVIDTTAFMWPKTEDSHNLFDYYIFKEFDNRSEYLDAIVENDRVVSLSKLLYREEATAFNELSKQGANYNPIDLVHLLSISCDGDLEKAFNEYNNTRVITLN